MTKITCSEFDKLKEAYVDGALSPQQQVAIEEHLLGCNQCARRLAIARNLAKGLPTILGATFKLPETAPARVQSGYASIVGAGQGREPSKVTRSYFAMGGLVLLLMAAAMIGAAQNITRPLNPDPTPTLVATISVPTIAAYIPDTSPTAALIEQDPNPLPMPFLTVEPTRCDPGKSCGSPTKPPGNTVTPKATGVRSATPTGKPVPTRCDPGTFCGTATRTPTCVPNTSCGTSTPRPTPTECSGSGCRTPLPTLTRVPSPTCGPGGLCASATPTCAPNVFCTTATPRPTPTECSNGACGTPVLTRTVVATPTCAPNLGCGTPTPTHTPDCPSGECRTPLPTNTRPPTSTRVATPTCGPGTMCETPTATNTPVCPNGCETPLPSRTVLLTPTC